jgi:hypothetical protein
VLDDPAMDSYLVHYFPPAAVEAAGESLVRAHQLRREIVATELVNDLGNLMGSSFLHRVSRDSGLAIPRVVRAWLVASRIAGAPEIRTDLATLEGRFPSETVYRWLAGLARVLEATTHWVLANTAPDSPTPALIDEARTGLATLRGGFARFVAGEDRGLFLSRLGELQDLGVDRTMAERLITLRFLPQLLEIVAAARPRARRRCAPPRPTTWSRSGWAPRGCARACAWPPATIPGIAATPRPWPTTSPPRSAAWWPRRRRAPTGLSRPRPRRAGGGARPRDARPARAPRRAAAGFAALGARARRAAADGRWRRGERYWWLAPEIPIDRGPGRLSIHWTIWTGKPRLALGSGCKPGPFCFSGEELQPPSIHRAVWPTAELSGQNVVRAVRLRGVEDLSADRAGYEIRNLSCTSCPP